MIRRTCLTEAEMDRIFELAVPRADGRRMSANRIAGLLGKSKNAVAWFMYRNGLKTKGRLKQQRAYRRPDGTLVRGYSDEEDAFIVARRREGLGCRAIADGVAERFGHSRRPSSIRVRLIMLAGFDDAAEETKERLAA